MEIISILILAVLLLNKMYCDEEKSLGVFTCLTEDYHNRIFTSIAGIIGSNWRERMM